jgi:hypothetical protein
MNAASSAAFSSSRGRIQVAVAQLPVLLYFQLSYFLGQQIVFGVEVESDSPGGGFKL